MSIKDLFAQRTHIDPNYFLYMVLEFIYPELNDLLGSSTTSCTLVLDNDLRRTAKIKVSSDSFIITRIKRNELPNRSE